jgi:hypothetical protein
VGPGRSRGTDRGIDNVKPLTPSGGIESFAQFGSDQTAAQALQVTETEVGVGNRGWIGVRTPAVRPTAQSYRSAYPVIELGLTA